MSTGQELVAVEPSQNGVHIAKLLPSRILDEPAISEIGLALNRLVDDGARRVIVDFSAVDHLSSTALGMLITVRQSISAVDGTIRLCSIRDEIYQVFRITGLDKLFTVHPTVTDALASFEE